jgi:oligoribonuclease NrnB/cAMP/cGMP phosphodiesterase (DHH superfamily)
VVDAFTEKQETKSHTAVFILRSDSGNPDSPDCAEIAQQHGGGGNRNAAGFQKKNIDFPHLFLG